MSQFDVLEARIIPKEGTVAWFRNFQGRQRWGHSSSPPSGRLQVTINVGILFCNETGPQFCAVLPCPLLMGMDSWVLGTAGKHSGLKADLRPFGYCCFKQTKPHPLQHSTLTPAGRWSPEASCCDSVVCGLLINHACCFMVWILPLTQKPRGLSLNVCSFLLCCLQCSQPSRVTQLSHQTTHLSSNLTLNVTSKGRH